MNDNTSESWSTRRWEREADPRDGAARALNIAEVARARAREQAWDRIEAAEGPVYPPASTTPEEGR